MTKETNLIDVKALSDRLSVSERTVYDLVRDGEIPYFKVGRLIRFDYPSVLAYLKVSPDKLVEINLHEVSKNTPKARKANVQPPKRKKGQRTDWSHPYYKSEG